MTFLASVLLLAACHTADPSALDWQKATTDRLVSLTGDTESPQCNVHLNIYYVAADSSQTAARDINETIGQQLLELSGLPVPAAADSFANKYTADYRRNFLPLYRDDKDDPEKRPWYQYHYAIDTSTEPGREGITVYKAEVDYYEGGAHGINQLLIMNFDNLSGHCYTLSDVFVPGYEGQLNDLLLEQLMRQTDSQSKTELKDKGYLYSMEIFAPENFILGTDAITFVYNPYEIAPYSTGKTELTIDYDNLKKILKKP